MSRVATLIGVLLVNLLFLPAVAMAHNLTLGTLTVVQQLEEERRFDVVFQMSGDQGSHLNSNLRIPQDCTVVTHDIEQEDETALRFRQTIQCQTPGLDGKAFTIEQISPNTSILARALIGNNVYQEKMMTGGDYEWKIESGASHSQSVVLDYIGLGIEHILIGWDHLLFLVMLILLVPFGWRLVQVVTAFTVGHSITLGLATLNIIKIPIPPTEALIALSIVFLAAEVIRFYSTQAKTLTIAYPGIVSALFGLFHGLGFASVLSDIGIPEDRILQTLFAFNVGVEMGQLAFVMFIFTVTQLIRRYVSHTPSKQALAYCGGSIGAFWLIERIVGF